ALAWHLAGRLDDAEREYRTLVVASDTLGAYRVLQSALTNLGDVSERRGAFAEALARYGRALTVLDTLRARQRTDRDAIKALAGRAYEYEAMIHLLGRLHAAAPDSGYAARGFEWAERSRARAFLDLAAASGAAPRAAETIGLDEA